MGPLLKSTTRWRYVPVRFKYLFLLATVFGGSFLLISINKGTELLFINNEQMLQNIDIHRSDYELDSFTIKTEGCTIPGLLPLDDSVKSFKHPPTDLKNCPHSNYSLILSNDTYIWIDEQVLPYYNVKYNNMSCYYEAFFRPDSVKHVESDSVDDRVQYKPSIEFTDYIEVGHEFVKVTCKSAGKSFYQQYFIFARKKPLSKHARKTTPTPQTKHSNHTPKTTLPYNVIVMGIDAISRLNFHRTMPKTLGYLKNKGAIELLGYNKLGDNTFPNVTPMLIGVKEADLKGTCWFDDSATFDNCPFVWQWFREAGFYTAFGEDSATLGTFNFGKNGFMKSPTDYYMRTFVNEAETNVGNNKDYNSYICMGNKYFYSILLDYIADLTSMLRKSKLFGFFWEVTMSHDYLNYPMAMDDTYELFLKKLDSFNYLDNTVFILLSDHGIRWGPIRLTKQGRLEERLPLVHILLPPSFQDKYNLAYKNLKLNSKRLTTPLDIYATMMDLVDLSQITNKNIKARTDTPYGRNRSISLFLPVPSNRTCETAEIDDHWCTCHKNNKLPSKSQEAHEVAIELVKLINKLVMDYRQCAELNLAEVIDVTEMLAGEPASDEVGWQEFMAVVRTSPGGGLFEGTLRKKHGNWTLAGTVSRLNLYGKQSHCVHHYQLKLYCYCG